MSFIYTYVFLLFLKPAQEKIKWSYLKKKNVFKNLLYAKRCFLIKNLVF
jgi:hypothetical protein